MRIVCSCSVQERILSIVNTMAVKGTNSFQLRRSPQLLSTLTNKGVEMQHYNRTFEKKSKHPHSRSVERLSY